MRTPLHLQPDYTTYQGFYQIKLPLEMETMIPADDPVRLLSAFVEGMDHSTIARFISLHLSACSKTIFANVTSILHDLGEISGKTIFIDGTKIESCANKYTFVWKKSVTKHLARLLEKIIFFIEECAALYGIKVVYNINKLHFKIQGGRTGQFLTELKAS